MAEENKKATEETSAPPRQGNGKLLLLAFIATVCLIESGMFFFLVPSADEVAALAEARLIEDIKEEKAAAKALEQQQNAIIEFDLGAYGVNYTSPTDGTGYRIEFDLFTEIMNENRELMQREFGNKDGRIRHEVLMKIRTSEPEDLNDPELTLLRRRILATCNQLLQKRVMLSVKFRDFQMIEE